MIYTDIDSYSGNAYKFVFSFAESVREQFDEPPERTWDPDLAKKYNVSGTPCYYILCPFH